MIMHFSYKAKVSSDTIMITIKVNGKVQLTHCEHLQAVENLKK